MQLIRRALPTVKPGLKQVRIQTDRQTLAKRRWRGQAEDGMDFGFDLHEPLADGTPVFESDTVSYILAQAPEPLLVLELGTPEESARVAWQIGNLHFPIALDHGTILVEGDPALRQLFAREQIPFRESTGVFCPVGSGAGGHSHHHHDHHDHHDHH